MATDQQIAYDLRRIAHLGSLIIVIGQGDGSLLAALAEHRQGKHKDIEVLALPGEVPLDGCPITKSTSITYCPDWAAVERWVVNAFGDHKDVVRLAGADIFDAHPLGDAAEAFRAKHLTHLRQLIADRAWGLGNDINDTFMGLWHAAQNAPAILGCPSIGQLAGSFGNVPAIAVGAGPSLADHIDALRELQHRCVIVACDSVYHRLLDAGVEAHFCTPLERLKQQTQFVERARGTKTIFAGIAACHPSTVAAFEGRCLYLHAADKLYEWLAPQERTCCVTGSSTGVLSVLVAGSLTRGPVYLVGHDLCFEDGGSTHWEADGVAAKAWETEQKNAGGFGTNGYEERWIPGNDGTPKRSITWWQHFGHEIATQTALGGPRFYNVNAHTKRYAKIEGTLAAPLPKAQDLPVLPPFTFNGDTTGRLENWRGRAAKLTEDGAGFLAAMQGLHEKFVKLWQSPPSTWNVEELTGQMRPDLGVSPGNSAAFQYFLRSSIYNDQSYASWCARRYRSVGQAHFHMSRIMDGLTDSLSNAVRHCQPLLDKIALESRSGG